MEIQEIKNNIIETQGFSQEELELYQLFFNNFNCKFESNKWEITNYELLSFIVNLNTTAKNTREVGEQLETAGINLGKIVREDNAGVFKGKRTVYENAWITEMNMEREDYYSFRKDKPTSGHIRESALNSLIKIYNPK